MSIFSSINSLLISSNIQTITQTTITTTTTIPQITTTTTTTTTTGPTGWVQIGSNIYGQGNGDQCGYSVSINSTGTTIVIGLPFNDYYAPLNSVDPNVNYGKVRVYDLIDSTWVQRGQDIIGNIFSRLGTSVSINNNGNVIAVGGPGYYKSGQQSAGVTRIYNWNGSSWVQRGTDITGTYALDNSGRSVSINSDGDVIVVGAWGNDDNGNDSGNVRVYIWNGSTWIQRGNDIDGEAAADRSGWSTDINDTGDIIAIGAYGNDGNGGSSGHVRVYAWNGSAWVQRGADINGEAIDDQSGYSLSLNSTGDVVAIGAPFNDGSGSNSGQVRVYAWNGSNWIKRGSDIDGEIANDNNGHSVSLNSTGDILAIGAPKNDENGSNSGYVRVYTWNGSSWTQLGSNINGEAVNDQGGWSVSLNSTGYVVAIGAINDSENDSGYVRVYRYITNTTSTTSTTTTTTASPIAWTQLGSDINQENIADNNGYSISINSTGNIIAIGALYNDGNGTSSGHVRIYVWNGSAWVQRGADIDGEAAGDESGHSVSINSTGDIVAIGARYNDGNGNNSGHVRIYTWNGSNWIQQGSDINGEAANDISGWSVSLNSTGDVVAIGAPNNNGNGSTSGHTRIYAWNGSSWLQRGTDIDGEAAGDGSGFSVSLNSVGDVVAIGAPFNDGSGSNSGQVRVYAWNGSAWVQRGTDINGEDASGDSGYSASLNSAGDVVAIGAPYNNSNIGHARIYSWNGSVWVQRGADIDGEAADRSGRSVSLNSTGDIVAIGAPSIMGISPGYTRIYFWNGSSWIQRGFDIDGDFNGDASGWSVSLNATGNIVAISSTYSGYVRVYQYL